MSVINRRNAVLGFVTLRAAQRYLERRHRKERVGRGLRVALWAGLALVSAGILAAAAAAFVRRRRRASEGREGYEVEEELAETPAEPEITAAEPIAAT